MGLKKQCAKWKKRFGHKAALGMSLCLMGVLLCGSKASATENRVTKETPMVNLMQSENVSITVGQEKRPLAEVDPDGAALVNDGDKYCLQNDHIGNKSSENPGVGATNGSYWEDYRELGSEIGKNANFIEVDLGEEYPIEVINLKRRMFKNTTYNNQNALSYEDTAIVISVDQEFSNPYVVHYNDNDDSLFELGFKPEWKPENQIGMGNYTEVMGGDWFYMDANTNGTEYTNLGVTRNARYIRVYSSNPTSDIDLMFMELAVYGYKNGEDKAENSARAGQKRKEINNENPLMIAAAYSDDQWDIGDDKVGLQGWNTIAGRWNAIPDDLKDNSVLMMHSNNLRSYAKQVNGKASHIGQAYIQAYYEACLKEAYQCDASTMLMLINASSTPEGGTSYCITRDVDYHWVDLMFRMYPNMEGVFNTENFWSYSFGNVAKTTAKMLEIADRFGGYVVWSEADHNNIHDSAIQQADFKQAIQEHGDAFYFIYKNTQGSNDCLHTQSLIMGSWLAGYTGGWGMLSDTWAWGNGGNGPLWHTSGGYNKNWKALCTQPEAIFGMQMLTTYLSGGCIYTFEFPEVVYGAIDENAPAYQHVVERVFRYICENPAPSRAEVLADTEVILYGDVNSATYNATTGADNEMAFMNTSRYGAIPSIPNWGTQTEVTEKLRQTAAKEGVASPRVLSNSDVLVQYGATEFFNSIYELEYLGDAFADKYNDAWYIYNNSINTNVTQTATLPLVAGTNTGRLKAIVDPHTFVIAKEEADGRISISLNNYRIDHQERIYNNRDWDWSGSSATGQGVSPGKLSVYRYMAYYNVAGAKENVYNHEQNSSGNSTITQLSPVDNQLRETTFTLNAVSEAPVVRVVRGQEADTDGYPQYEQPVVDYNSETKTATITIKTNGWVELEVSNFNFVENNDADRIVDEVVGYAEPGNVAFEKEVTASHQPSGGSVHMARPLNWITDGVKIAEKYSDPASNPGGAIWAEIDLGSIHRVENVKLFRYWTDSREYKDTVILLSRDKNFAPDKTLVLWNANNGNDDGSEIIWQGNGNNSVSTHTLPQGTNEMYEETQEGRTFNVYDSSVKWLGEGVTKAIPIGDDSYRFEAQYVRVYMNGHQRTDGSNHPTNHIVEIEVTGEAKIEEERVYTNVAANSGITSSASQGDRPFSRVVDGQYNNRDNYTEIGNDKQWLQLDMGVIHQVEKVVLHRYYDNRQYHDNVVMISSTPDFAADKTLVLFNSNNEEGEVWPGKIAGSAGENHSLPIGTDSSYNETAEGKTMEVNGSNVKWLDGQTLEQRPLEGEGNRFAARYLRVYSNGNTSNNSNHIVEIQVFGERGIFSLYDYEIPERVLTTIEEDMPQEEIMVQEIMEKEIEEEIPVTEEPIISEEEKTKTEEEIVPEEEKTETEEKGDDPVVEEGEAESDLSPSVSGVEAESGIDELAEEESLEEEPVEEEAVEEELAEGETIVEPSEAITNE